MGKGFAKTSIQPDKIKEREAQVDNLIKTFDRNHMSNIQMRNSLSAYFNSVFKEIMNSDSTEKLEDYEKTEHILIEYIKNEHFDISHEAGEVLFNVDFNSLEMSGHFSTYFEPTNDFKKKLSQMDHDTYKNMLNDLKDNYVNEGLLNDGNREDKIKNLEHAISKLKAFENARENRGFFRSIIDFFTGRKKDEDNIIKEMKESISNVAYDIGLNMDNVKGVLADTKECSPSLIREEVNIYQSIKDYNKQKEKKAEKMPSIFSEKDFKIKLEPTKEELDNNIYEISIAIEKYNSLEKLNKTSKNLMAHFKQELKEACESVNVKGSDFNKILELNDFDDIRYRIEQCNPEIIKDNGELIEVNELNESIDKNQEILKTIDEIEQIKEIEL